MNIRKVKMRSTLLLRLGIWFVFCLLIGSSFSIGCILIGYHTDILTAFSSLSVPYSFEEIYEDTFIAIRKDGKIQYVWIRLEEKLPDFMETNPAKYGLEIHDGITTLTDARAYASWFFQKEISMEDVIPYVVFPTASPEGVLFRIIVYDVDRYPSEEVKNEIISGINADNFPFPYIFQFELEDSESLYKFMNLYSYDFIVKDSQKEGVILTNVQDISLQVGNILDSHQLQNLLLLASENRVQDSISRLFHRKPRYTAIDIPVLLPTHPVFYISYGIRGNLSILYLLSLLIGLLGFFFFFFLGSYKIVLYIREINIGINRISNGNLSISVPVKGNDELANLAFNMNCMMTTLQNQFREQRDMLAFHDRFIANISHDLMTPITTILGYLTLIEKQKWSSIADVFSYARGAIHKTDELKLMIQNILTYTVMMKDHPITNIRTIPWNEVYNQYREEIVVFFSLTDFTFQTENECTYTGEVLCSNTYLSRVIGNILMNITQHGSCDQKVLIHIREKEEHIEFMFCNTVNAKKSPSKAYQDKFCYETKNNHGMGLIICEQLMVLQKGYLQRQTILSEDTEEVSDTFKISIGIRKRTSM